MKEGADELSLKVSGLTKSDIWEGTSRKDKSLSEVIESGIYRKFLEY